MPVLPNSIAPGPSPPPPRVFANPEEASVAGAAGVRAGNEVQSSFENFLDKYQDAARQSDISSAVAGVSTQLGDLKQKWGHVPDRTAAVAGFEKDAGIARDDNGQLMPVPGGMIDKTLSAMSDPIGQQYARGQLMKLAASYSLDTGTDAFSLEGARRVGDLDDHMVNYAQQMAATQNPAAKAILADNATAEIKGAIAAGWMRGDMGEQKLIEFRQNVTRVQAEQDRNAVIASNNPAAVAAWATKINDPAQYPDLNPQIRETLGYRADFLQKAAEDKAQVQARAGVRSAFSDNLAALERTGAGAVPLSEAQIRYAYPQEADDMIRQLNTARDVYHAVQTTALTSPNEDAALIDRWTPQGQGFAEQAQAQDGLRKALAMKYKQLGDDPAGYVVSASPAIASLFQLAQKDPSKTGPAVSALDAAYDKLGVAPEDRRVLPVAMAQQLVTSITAQPDQAPAALKKMAQQFGDAWPRVFHDLSTIKGGLPASFQAVPVLDNERDGAILARWLAQLPSGKTATDLLGAKPENDIKSGVRADPGVQSLMISLSRSGASVGQVDGVLNAIDALAFAKTYFDHDPRAALNAASAFTGQYEFMPNGGARVPRDDFANVSAGAAASLQGLSLDNIIMPPVYGRPGMPSADDYLAAIRAAPSWITSPRADAIWLMDPAGRLVRDKNERPIAVPFIRAASPNPAPALPSYGELMMQSAGEGLAIPP